MSEASLSESPCMFSAESGERGREVSGRKKDGKKRNKTKKFDKLIINLIKTI